MGWGGEPCVGGCEGVGGPGWEDVKVLGSLGSRGIWGA